ncbi:MAG: DUF5714 domain-containing protein [Spirochaetia bacterium]
MEHKSGCLVCGAELVYSEHDRDVTCTYCGTAGHANVACAEGHFVCDSCHSGSANDLIERFCAAADSVRPVAMAITQMKDRRLKMHGPEHHFLVPAVLLAARGNAACRPREETAALIAKARSRAGEVKGGSCGFNGNCGAAVGTGIFVSLVTGATPLSRAEWRLANLMTSESLRAIAERGGPRCCKRDVFLALREAAAFLNTQMGLTLPSEEPVVCEFSALNRECLKDACPFFRTLSGRVPA